MGKSTFFRTMAGTVSAVALTVAFSAGAMAACPSGEFGYYTLGTDADGNDIAVENCRKVWDKGHELATTGSSVKLTPVMVDDDNDPSTPNVPLIIDNKAIVQQPLPDHNLDRSAKVVGIDGVAVGNGSQVGWSKFVEQVGTGPDCTQGKLSADKTTCVNRFGTPKPEWYVPASEDYVAAHWETKPVTNGTALGANSSVQADGGTAVGAGAQVKEGHTNSTAIGTGATTTRGNQVMIGTAGQTVTAPGVYGDTARSFQDKDSIQVVTSDKNGNLATDGGAIAQHLGRLDAQTAANSAAIASLRGDVSTLYKLNAMAVAMPDAYLNEHERFSLAGGVGFNGDETGFGFAGAVRFDKNWSGYGGVAFSGGEAVGKVGARVGW